MNPLIFREYDIPGVMDKDFNVDDAEKIGRAYATYVTEHGGRRCVVGRDCRMSSQAIRDALIKGITNLQ